MNLKKNSIAKFRVKKEFVSAELSDLRAMCEVKNVAENVWREGERKKERVKEKNERKSKKNRMKEMELRYICKP